MRRIAQATATVLVLAAAAAPAAEFGQTFTVQEPLGHTWTDELVHRDVAIQEPRVAATTLALYDSEGTSVPLQVEVLEGSADAVRRIRAWFQVTLPRGADLSYRLTYNDERRAAASPVIEGGASVRRESDQIVLSTGTMEASVAAPARPFAAPRDLASVPPPILGLRPAGGSVWLGRWSLEGAAKVREVRASVEAAGPLWAEVRLRYVFDRSGLTYEVALRAVRNAPYIDVTEKYRIGEGVRALWWPGHALEPTDALLMPLSAGKDGKAESVHDLRRVRLSGADDGLLTVLRPRWTQARQASQAFLAVAPGDGSLAVGAAMIAPADWTRPYDQFVTVRQTAAGRELVMTFPLADGRRRWLLVAGPAARFDTRGELQGILRRAADIPLDRVLNEWVLRWPRDARAAAPHILTTRERLEAIRTSLSSGPGSASARLVQGALVGESRGDRHLAEFLAGKRDDMGTTVVPLAAMYLTRSYQDDFLVSPTWARRVAEAMRLADLSAAGQPAGDAAAAMLGYVFTDPNYWPGQAAGWQAGPVGSNMDIYTVPIYAAAMMPDHPHARRWLAAGLDATREDLRRLVGQSDGTAAACPGRIVELLVPMLRLMRTAQQSGLDDPFRWPEVREAVEFLRLLHGPPDPRTGRRMLAPLGETPWPQNAAGAVFGLAAAGTRPSDARTAAAWMSIYRHYYGDKGTGDLVQDVLLTDADIPPGWLEDLSWSSRRFAGFGAVLRSRFGQAGETFATFKCGAFGAGYHGDELGLHFYGAGQPLALDWSCGSRPPVYQEHMHNRLSFGDFENMDSTGELVAFETSAAGDVAVGQIRTARLRRLPRYPHETAAGAAYPRRTLPSETRWRRYVLLVKHPTGPMEDYLVVRDEPVSTEPATFNLFVLARAVRRDGQAFHFDGQLDADAALFMATGLPDRVALDSWGWPKQDASSMVAADFEPGSQRFRAGEWQQAVRITEAPGRPFTAVLYPHRKGAPVPTFQPLAGGRGVRVTLGKTSEDIYLATDAPGEAGGQAVVRRGAENAVLIRPRTLGSL